LNALPINPIGHEIVQDTKINKDKEFNIVINTYIRKSHKMVLAKDGVTAMSDNMKFQPTTIAPIPSREHLSVDQLGGCSHE
jgi:hypothetical protein